MAGEIIVGHLCTKYKYTQIYLKATGNGKTGQPPVQSNRSGNREGGNWSTTCAVKSGKWLGKSCSNTCVLSTGTQIYLKATANGKIRQPPVQSYRAGGWGNHCRTTNYDLSIGNRKYLKGTGNKETDQPPVQSNRAGGRGNHCRTPVY
ncbi:hypothetical protein GBA52_014942 [Prunus armeniaca]|nr:hypothetical protein GBA52_014942 [Prunus armeniaca]